MNIDIFYDEPKSEAFFKMPKSLFSEKYKDLPAEAKLLYGLMLDRTSLSAKNKWCDKNGEIFIYYTIAETCEKLGCGHDKSTRLQRSLVKHKLIRRVNQGKGKPSRLYVLNADTNDFVGQLCPIK